MLKTAIIATVDACTRRAVQVIALAVLLAIGSGIYAARHFAIDADVNKLISKDLPWRQREAAFDKSFPSKEETILAVVDAPTSELAAQSTAALIQKLSGDTKLFRAITELGGGPFFRRNGLLFLPTQQVVETTRKLGEAKPIIQALAQDSNLRGLTTALNYGLIGARMKHYTLDNLAGTMNMVANTLDEVIAGRWASFSWHAMLNGRPPTPSEARRFIEFRPVLDFTALTPGKAATDAIRKAAADLNFESQFHARLRLTGPVPIADEEFATVQEGAFVNTAGTILVVLTILWLALRSWRIISAVFISLLIGLSITMALGLAMVGALNLISVAFAVLFIGLGVDFGIQFSVRYRAERHDNDNLHEALLSTARYVGAPLTLAAAATAAGFLSFLPTDYKGVSELGQLAGLGMIVAFLTSITVIPALLTVLNPPGEPKEMGYKALAPVDRFMERHRIPVIVGTGLVVAAGLPLLWHLQFDFNPLNLRSPKVESVATFLDLRSDPALGANSIFVLAPSIQAAKADAEKLAKLPEVASVKTIESFIPTDQEPKLAAIRKLASVLTPVMQPDPAKKPPTDADNVAALKAAVDNLKQAAHRTGRPGRHGGDAACRRSRQARRRRRGAAGTRAGRADLAAQDRARRIARLHAGAAGHARNAAARDRSRLDHQGRPRQDRGAAEGRSERQRDAAHIRRRGAGGRAECHWRPDLDSRIRPHHDQIVLRGRFLGAGLDRASALDRAPPVRRRAADADPADPGGRGDDGADGDPRHEAQLRQHHRAAAAARPRRCVQDLLHHGMAGGADRSVAVEPDARGVLQRLHHRDGVRQPVAVEPSRHVEHGQADGARARHHDVRGGAVPAGADGAATGESRALRLRRRCLQAVLMAGLSVGTTPPAYSRRRAPGHPSLRS